MSPSGDRVAVPTNGHRPPLTDPEADADLAEATDLGDGAPNLEAPVPVGPWSWPSRPCQPVSSRPGSGIVAALILLVLGPSARPRLTAARPSPMPIEPPVTSPRDLAEAYARLARARPRRRSGPSPAART